MKPLLLFLLSVLFTLPLFSQDTLNRTDASGMKQGYWIKKTPDGKKIYEGRFRDGHPVGEFRYFYETGVTKAVSRFSDDGRTANSVMYFTNGGKMAEGTYVDEKREGVWKFYSEADGILLSEENFVKGKKEGISKTFYAGKGIAELSNWKNGMHDGLWEQYYSDGKVKFRCTYREDRKEGPVAAFSPAGKTIMTGQYLAGSPDGLWLYYDDLGNIARRETYLKGYLITKEGELDKEMEVPMKKE